MNPCLYLTLVPLKPITFAMTAKKAYSILKSSNFKGSLSLNLHLLIFNNSLFGTLGPHMIIYIIFFQT